MTGQPIENLPKIMNDFSVSMDQIYIQSLQFDAQTYLKAVHATTGIEKMQSCLKELQF